jgi:hypothetical protein
VSFHQRQFVSYAAITKLPCPFTTSSPVCMSTDYKKDKENRLKTNSYTPFQITRVIEGRVLPAIQTPNLVDGLQHFPNDHPRDQNGAWSFFFNLFCFSFFLIKNQSSPPHIFMFHGPYRLFVNRSLQFSNVGTHLVLTIPSSFKSRRKYCRILSCRTLPSSLLLLISKIIVSWTRRPRSVRKSELYISFFLLLAASALRLIHVLALPELL